MPYWAVIAVHVLAIGRIIQVLLLLTIGMQTLIWELIHQLDVISTFIVRMDLIMSKHGVIKVDLKCMNNKP